MTKRMITLTIVLLLLLTPATGTMSTVSLATGHPPSNKEKIKEEQIKAEVERAIVDARRSATYDEAGRVSKVTIDLPSLGNFNFEYQYDQQNRLQYILDGKGRRTEYQYGAAGELRAITLPDGTRIYELDEDGKGVFFKDGISFGRGNVPQKLPVGISGLDLVRAAMMDGGDCPIAVATAAAAVAAAAITCMGGDASGCMAAVITASVAVAAAKKACGGSGSAEPETPVV